MKASSKRKTAGEIRIDDQFCKGCGLCVRVCPRKVFGRGERRSRAGYVLPEVLSVENCAVCLLCEMTCPDLALTVVEETK